MFGVIVFVFITTALQPINSIKDKFSTVAQQDFHPSTRIVRELKHEKPSETEQILCKPAQNCYNDSDCYGGHCLGIAIGKCNCAACATFAHCTSDEQCGGLKGACTDLKYCDCDRGFKNVGFDGTFDAFMKICNVRDCIPNTSSCFGLPCNSGFCACPV